MNKNFKKYDAKKNKQINRNTKIRIQRLNFVVPNTKGNKSNQINKFYHYLIKLALMRITLTTRDIVNAAINAIEISVIDFVSLV